MHVHYDIFDDNLYLPFDKNVCLVTSGVIPAMIAHCTSIIVM